MNYIALDDENGIEHRYKLVECEKEGPCDGCALYRRCKELRSDGEFFCLAVIPMFFPDRKDDWGLTVEFEEIEIEDYNDNIDIDGSPIFNYGRFIEDFKKYMKGE